MRGDPGEIVEAKGLFEIQPIQRCPPPANAADQFGQAGAFDPHPLAERKVLVARHARAVLGNVDEHAFAAPQPGEHLDRHTEPHPARTRLSAHSPKCHALFGELARHSGRVVTHSRLLATIWGEAHIADVEHLRVTMRGLRAKLKADPASPAPLINDPGIGCRLEGG